MRTGERPVAVDFDALDGFDNIIDVRSPGEFLLDHVPGSSNHPVLEDHERAEIGTLYKQVSPFLARKRGAVLVSRNIARHLENAFAERPREWRPLVLCWRGGQRSGAMAHVLRAVGWDAVQLQGGYKSWRAHVIARLQALPPRMQWCVVCGPTGSGKSRLLQALQVLGAQVLDLEALACHRGSVLGGLPGQPQPAQRLFESRLMQALAGFDLKRPVFVEAESRRIGKVHLPEVLISAMRSGSCVRIEADQAARVSLLLAEYQHFLADLPSLKDMLGRLVELHGREQITAWGALADQGAFPALVEQLLSTHYDPLYRRSSDSKYRGMADAVRLDGGALEDSDFARLARGLQDVP
jgi:tRNA 2-selenouridine synthase